MKRSPDAKREDVIKGRVSIKLGTNGDDRLENRQGHVTYCLH